MDREKKSGERAIMFAYDRRWDTGIAFMCVWYEWRCSWRVLERLGLATDLSTRGCTCTEICLFDYCNITRFAKTRYTNS
jgi:hypothetical protein